MNLSTHKKSEVDIRVAQELKNNQDFIYETNQALQTLRQGIVALSLQQEKLMAKFNSFVKSIEIDIENLKKDVFDKTKQQDGKISEYENIIFKFTHDSTKKFAFINDNFVEDFAFEKTVERIDKNHKKLYEEVKVLNGDILKSLSIVQGIMNHEIEMLRQELTPVIPEVDPVKKEMEEKLKTVYVDFAGLVKEIAICKKRINYGEKKFENLYTLIERLKEGKQ